MSSDKNISFKMESSFLWWNEVTCAQDHTCFRVSKRRLLLREQFGEGPRWGERAEGGAFDTAHLDARWPHGGKTHRCDVGQGHDGTYEGCLSNEIFQALNWPVATLQSSLRKIIQDRCNLGCMVHFAMHLLVSSSPPPPPPMRSLSVVCSSDPNPPYD